MPQKRIRVRFLEEYTLDEVSIGFVQGAIGIYFIYLHDLRIPYPFKSSRLVYIGMSESRQNSVGNRLRAHRKGHSGNLAIANYATRHRVNFTCHTLDVLRVLGTENLLELESFYLADFLRKHGAFPLCNGQSGVSFPNTSLSEEGIEVDWDYFA